MLDPQPQNGMHMQKKKKGNELKNEGRPEHMDV